MVVINITICVCTTEHNHTLANKHTFTHRRLSIWTLKCWITCGNANTHVKKDTHTRKNNTAVLWVIYVVRRLFRVGRLIRHAKASHTMRHMFVVSERWRFLACLFVMCLVCIRCRLPMICGCDVMHVTYPFYSQHSGNQPEHFCNRCAVSTISMPLERLIGTHRAQR